MIEQTLHGLVVGIGKIRKDGSKEFHWLDKPIHNRIVSGGLDAYFMFNGNQTSAQTDTNYGGRFYPANTSSSTYRDCGLLRYIAIGTDGTPTKFTDTGLKAQVGGYSNSISYTALPFIGTRIEPPDSVSFRVQNTSVAVGLDTSVREIGWFEKYTTSETYVMFSRVVLPTPVELLAGESLTVVYQMKVTYANMTEAETPSSLVSGLLDSDGNPLRGRSSFRLYFRDSFSQNTWFLRQQLYCTCFGISYYPSYNPQLSYPYANMQGYSFSAPFDNSVKQTYGGAPNKTNSFCYATSPTWQMSIPQFGVITDQSSGTGADNLLTQSDLNNISCTVEPYVLGSYYRDKSFVLKPNWPTMSNPGDYQDVYAICCNSHLTRFGYMDNTDPSNPVWVPKPWRKEYGKSYKFTFRYKLSTADTVNS